MKKHQANIVILIILIVNQLPLFSQLKAAKLISTFDEKDKHYIDTVYCREKYETTFILPVERTIKQVVVGDPDEWEVVGSSGGRILSVKPLRDADQTSLTILTRSLKVYKFNIVNIRRAAYPGFDVMAIVEIREKNTTMEVIKGDDLPGQEIKPQPDEQNPADRMKIEKKIDEPIMHLDHGYRWKDRFYYIDNVYDDGIFTYIVMPKSQEYPCVYISSGKRRKRLEPVRWVVKSGMIVVHRLIRGREALVLRMGAGKDKRQALIYRKKRSRRRWI